MPLEIEVDQLFTDELAEPAIYQRGDYLCSVDAIAVYGESEDVMIGDAIVSHSSMEFLIIANQLHIDGQTAKPQRGDVIKQCDGSMFDVLPIDGDRCWRYADGQKQLIRVRTSNRD